MTHRVHSTKSVATLGGNSIVLDRVSATPAATRRPSTRTQKAVQSDPEPEIAPPVYSPPPAVQTPPPPPPTPMPTATEMPPPPPVAPQTTPAAPVVVEPRPVESQTVVSKTKIIQILPEVHERFESASTSTYQNQIRPLTAPELEPLAIEQSRAANRLYIYSFESLARADWYDFMYEVRGLTGNRPESDFISIQTFQPRTATSAADQPTVGGDASLARYGQYNLQALRTPARPGSVPAASSLFPPPPAGAGAPPPLIPPSPQGGSGASSPPVPRSPFGGATLSEQEDEALRRPTRPRVLSATDVITTINQNVLDDPDIRTVMSGTKLTELQQRIDDLHDLRALENAKLAADEASLIRRELRQSLAANSPWLNDPLQATGVVILQPPYVAAMRKAAALIDLYAADTSLANVPASEYIRRRPPTYLPNGKPDTAAASARSFFARLVADCMLQRRMLAGVGVRNKGDHQYMINEENAVIAEVKYRFGYDSSRQTFYMVSPRNDERRQPVTQRASELRYEPYASTLGPEYGRSGGRAPSILDKRGQILTNMIANS